jgi:hypothetical protein
MEILNDNLAQKLPGPLSDAYFAFINERDDQPFRKVHRLIDLIEVFCKIYTVGSVATFLDTLRLKMDEPYHAISEDAFIKIKVMLAAGLKTPSLGIWWKFARDIAAILQELNIPHILPGAEKELLNGKSSIKKAFDGENNLISFRNSYAHGATPSDEACIKDINTIWPKMLQMLQDAESLSNSKMLIYALDGKCYETRGQELILISEPTEALTGHTFICDGNRKIDAYPLLSFKIKNNNAVFFFYNDLKDKYANYLNYPFAEHLKDATLKQEILQYIPIEEWKKIGNIDMEPFRQQVELLTEVFKGRKNELSDIASFLTSESLAVLCIWGPPGVGKSALLARVTQIARYNLEVRHMMEEGNNWPDSKIYLVEYFIRRGATDNANHFFDSLNQRLDLLFNLRLEYGKTEGEKQALFTSRLQLIAKQIKDEEQLIFIIDGLDEIKKGDPLLSLLPRIIPAKIKFIYGARPQQELRFTFYEQLHREQRKQFDLGGLSKEDIRAVLMEHVSKYEITQQYIEDVISISEGNPLYLKLLCQGLEQKIYILNQSEFLPRGMEELYQTALLRLEKELPGSIGFLIFLSAAKDFVSLELMASWLQVDTSYVRNHLLYACMEFLFENPLTNSVEDYQLFHESLREYLKRNYPLDVENCSEHICDWSVNWKLPNGDRAFDGNILEYAMQYTTEHLYESFLLHTRKKHNRLALERRIQLFTLAESEEWRSVNFETCGNGESISKSYYYLQKILVTEDLDGEKLETFFSYAINRYLEPGRRYMSQRNTLMCPINKEKIATHLERTPSLSKMGERTEDKILLALIPIWANEVKSENIPYAFNEKMDEWLNNSRDKTIKLLWKKTFN